MAVPKFQAFLHPALSLLAEKSPMHVTKVREVIAEQFHLTEDELRELSAGGRKRFPNRVAWALVHLRMGKLVLGQGLGIYEITPDGREFLKLHEGGFLLADVSAVPGYKDAHAGRKGAKVKLDPVPDDTPEERMETAFAEIRLALGDLLLERILAESPEDFEQLVVDLLVKMGYGGPVDGSAERLGCAGDGGVDGVVRQDVLGLDVIYVQAKRWKGSVGRPEVQAFVGSLEGQHATKGVMLTTSTFTSNAKDYAASVSKQVILVDGQDLVRHMMDFGLGVQTAKVYEVSKLDLDYFEPDE